MAQRPASPIAKAESLHGAVVTRLRAMIQDGELAPGEQIVETSLSAMFGISRTPMREALKVLASEGLVELRPRRTPVVATVDASEIMAIFEVMEGLEALAGRRAAENATPEDMAALWSKHAELVACQAHGDKIGYMARNNEFHDMIVQLAGNSVLAATYAGFVVKIQRARAAANYDDVRWHESTAEHELILKAFESGTPDEVATALVDHMRRTGRAVLRTLTAIHGLSPGEQGGRRMPSPDTRRSTSWRATPAIATAS